MVVTSCAVVGGHDYFPSRMGHTMCRFANRELNAYVPGGFEFVTGRDIAEGHPGLGARDLLHLSVCRRRDVDSIFTFDRRLAAAFSASIACCDACLSGVVLPGLI